MRNSQQRNLRACQSEEGKTKKYTRIKPVKSEVELIEIYDDTASEASAKIGTKSIKTELEKEQTGRKKIAEQSKDKVESKNLNKFKKEEIYAFCSMCEEASDDLTLCAGVCGRSFHFDCLGLGSKPKKFSCDECLTGHHTCFSCKKTGELIKCSQVSCGKFYHPDCMKALQNFKQDDKPKSKPKQKEVNVNRFFCPQHSCKVCVQEKASNPAVTSIPNSKLVRCIRCPTAYHQKTCFIAGCQVITSQFMICDQHYEEENRKKKNHVNVTWCFVCSHGGTLVCCDTCPASFHLECLDDIDGVPEGAWKCKNCREHKKPKYGDIVWVKFGVYRWWPGIICFPEEIPERIANLPHSPGEFPLMFFGSHDYSWIHSGRVFQYEEGDKGSSLKKSTSLGKHFSKALEEAKLAYVDYKKEQDLLTESLDKRKSKKPPPYKSIKVNRPVSCIRTILDQSEWPICECSAEDGCTAESECLNRMLYFECNAKTCKAGAACQNQRIQKFQYKKAKAIKAEGKGWGLKSEEEIKSGDLVVEYVGELIDEATCQKRVQEYHENEISDYYFLTIDRDNIIDAYPKGNLSRFMNHSCNPNCETQKWTVNGEVRVGLFANRDIAVGEELSFNYNLDSLGNEKKQCKCGAENCSGFLGVKPKTQHAMSMAAKAQKGNKKIKRKQKRVKKQPKAPKTVHEDDCFQCNDGGDLILCSRGGCTKSYHLKCLSLEKKPYGKWECPWHFCDTCGKTAKAMCALCTNSYCETHKDGELFPLRQDVTVCSDHSEEEFKKFILSLDEKLNALTVLNEASPAPSVTSSVEIVDVKEATPIEILDDGEDAPLKKEGRNKRKTKQEITLQEEPSKKKSRKPRIRGSKAV